MNADNLIFRHKRRKNCTDAVKAYLAVSSGTCTEIGQAIGYARQTVHQVVEKMRDEGSPLLANLRAGLRSEAICRAAAERQAEREKLRAGEKIVEQALATRTALEEVWRA